MRDEKKKKRLRERRTMLVNQRRQKPRTSKERVEDVEAAFPTSTLGLPHCVVASLAVCGLASEMMT